MKSTVYLGVAAVLSLVLVVVLLFKIAALDRQVQRLNASTSEANGLQTTLKQVQAELAAVKETRPGLAEYMIMIQLHAAKLWFAARAANWQLAGYQAHEIEETMEAVKALNAEENGVKISNVMDAVLQTQIVQLEKAIESRNQGEFQKAYDETLSACNGCHTETGHKYIQVIRPTAPPVTNQRWKMEITKQ
jgi:hypothetical protein